MSTDRLTRRVFMRDLGKGGIAVAIFALAAAACSSDNPGDPEPTPDGDLPEVDDSPATRRIAWERVHLGFVSAYVLARRGEAAIVDTGVSGSEGAIEAVLTALDLGWVDVGSVIVTHLHDDHQGSLPAVLNLAADATGYAGAGDISSIGSPRKLVPVGDGDTVFGLEIIETPGHTPGHISVLDKAGGVLIAGDALTGSNGGVAGPNPEFTDDLPTAGQSVRKLADLTYETAVFGHGEPVVGSASQKVADLAASL